MGVACQDALEHLLFTKLRSCIWKFKFKVETHLEITQADREHITASSKRPEINGHTKLWFLTSCPQKRCAKQNNSLDFENIVILRCTSPASKFRLTTLPDRD